IAASISSRERTVTTGLSGIPDLFPCAAGLRSGVTAVVRSIRLTKSKVGRGYPLCMVDISGVRRLAKSVSATGARAKALSGPWPNERRLAAAGLMVLVLLSVGLRLVPTVLVPSLNWGDEIFQSIEQAHRLVYGYGLVPWEFQLGMRSWLVPGFVAIIMEM